MTRLIVNEIRDIENRSIKRLYGIDPDDTFLFNIMAEIYYAVKREVD